MVVRVPFVRWARVKNPSLTSSRAAIFYLKTAEGEKVSCVPAVRGEKNRITYKAFGSFLDDYRELLPSGGASEWKFGCMLAQWMDGIIYHSFLRNSEEGASNAWHLNYFGPADSAQASPNGLCNYFPGGGVSIWILIRHGFRAWPIEVVNFQFGESWDTFSETHNLKSDFKSPCDVNESGFSILQSLKKVVKNLFTGGLVQICSGGNFMIHQPSFC